MDYEEHYARKLSVTMPNSVLFIAYNAFERLLIKDIRLSENLLKFSSYSFKEQDIMHISIPHHIKILPKGLFYGCDQLNEIAIPASVQEIAYDFASKSIFHSMNHRDEKTTVTIYGKQGSVAESIARDLEFE